MAYSSADVNRFGDHIALSDAPFYWDFVGYLIIIQLYLHGSAGVYALDQL